MSELICITNRALCKDDFLSRIGQIAAAHPDRIILREKDLPEPEYTALAEQVMEICRKYGVTCTLHSHPEAAQKLGAQSLHLPLPLLQSCRIFHFGTLSMTHEGVRAATKAAIAAAKAAGVPFAAAGWAYDIPEIEQFMRKHCGLYFKTVEALRNYLFEENP